MGALRGASVAALLFLGCGPSGGGDPIAAACRSRADCAEGEQCLDGRCVTGPAPMTDAGPSGVCTTGSDCPGAICYNGQCCEDADRICGSTCCHGEDVCFANRCVTPGRDCTSSADCDAAQFCQPAIDPMGGDIPTPEEPPGECEPPVPGRCLDLPPRCDDAPADDGLCIHECEYHPPVDALRVAVEWEWQPATHPEHVDIWSTPAVGRLHDSSCDGRIDARDAPAVVFVSGNARGTCCSCGGFMPSTCLTGVLRAVDGATGRELWSLDRPSADSIGFAGLSVALGDLDEIDPLLEIAVATGEGRIAIVDGDGTVLTVSEQRVRGWDAGGFGWGGALAIADMDGDGAPEIAYGSTVFSYAGGVLTRRFVGTAGTGGGDGRAISVIAEVDGDPALELVAGNTVYELDGTVRWTRPGLPDGFPAVADLDRDGLPEVVLVGGGQVFVLEGATGATELGPTPLGTTGEGGPPTVADFDGDGAPEIGVAQAQIYAMLEPDYAARMLRMPWQTPNHDLSSSVTGSTVFDFEGDGIAEVVYGDECFLWVFDGPTGNVRFATPHTSFTATEASVVADVDADGHADILMVSNGADPSAAGWGCDVAPWNRADPTSARPAWVAPAGGRAYRGLVLFRDAADAWVGTRPLWNQHSYHVSNVCDEGDDACDPPGHHGEIPARQRDNWRVPWLNNFRQNVQGEGIFDAPDATLTLAVDCTEPPLLRAGVRNLGEAALPAGVEVAFAVRRGGADVPLGTARTGRVLFPGEAIEVELPAMGTAPTDTFVARIVTGEAAAFRECREDNNGAEVIGASCLE